MIWSAIGFAALVTLIGLVVFWPRGGAPLAVTALLSLLFVGWSNLTGLSDESALFLTSLGVKVDLQGIVLAGFVIGALGALGVLDDVTVTQVSAVEKLHAAQPNLTRSQLYRSAVTIGRDHISSTVNTLFLANAGAALPLLLFTLANQSVSSLAGREVDRNRDHQIVDRLDRSGLRRADHHLARRSKPSRPTPSTSGQIVSHQVNRVGMGRLELPTPCSQI